MNIIERAEKFLSEWDHLGEYNHVVPLVCDLLAELKQLENARLSVICDYADRNDRLGVELYEANQRIATLEAELAKHQESQFHPDWSMLEATRDALKECQKETDSLKVVCGCNDIEVTRADGDRDGIGLPTRLTIRRGESVEEYTIERLTATDIMQMTAVKLYRGHIIGMAAVIKEKYNL